MSIIIGFIFNNEAFIASDTLVTNYEKNFTEQKSGFRKILHYALNPENFLIGVGGILTEINQFTEALKNLQITGDYICVNDFSLYCRNILKSLSLENVTLIIAGYDSIPRIRLVVSKGIEIQEDEMGFLFMPPGSCSAEEQKLIHAFFTPEEVVKYPRRCTEYAEKCS